jgi:hypothetical protein
MYPKLSAGNCKRKEENAYEKMLRTGKSSARAQERKRGINTAYGIKSVHRLQAENILTEESWPPVQEISLGISRELRCAGRVLKLDSGATGPVRTGADSGPGGRAEYLEDREIGQIRRRQNTFPKTECHTLLLQILAHPLVSCTKRIDDENHKMKKNHNRFVHNTNYTFGFWFSDLQNIMFLLIRSCNSMHHFIIRYQL